MNSGLVDQAEPLGIVEETLQSQPPSRRGVAKDLLKSVEADSSLFSKEMALRLLFDAGVEETEEIPEELLAIPRRGDPPKPGEGIGQRPDPRLESLSKLRLRGGPPHGMLLELARRAALHPLVPARRSRSRHASPERMAISGA